MIVFFVVDKELFDAIKLHDGDPEELNIELSKYYLTDHDIKEIRRIGANVVRIGFRLWQIERKPYSYSQKSLNHLDNTITRFGKYGIYVILDLHAAGQNRFTHNREYGNVLWKDAEFQNRVIALWRCIANRYKDRPWVAGYDLINEPQAPTRMALHRFYQKTMYEIRNENNKHIIFIEVNIDKDRNILFGGEYDDANLVLSIHFYEPGRFTSQGRRGRPTGLKYPALYGGIYWDKNRIDKEFNQVIATNRNNRRPLFVGEFGATVWSGGHYALQWVKDIIEVMNTRDVHYTYFLYKALMRGSRAHYVPRREVFGKIKVLRKNIMKGTIKYNNLTEEKSRLFLTENFESSQELRQVLKKGFEGKLSE